MSRGETESEEKFKLLLRNKLINWWTNKKKHHTKIELKSVIKTVNYDKSS